MDRLVPERGQGARLVRLSFARRIDEVPTGDDTGDMNVIAKKFTPIRPGARRTGQDNIAAALGEEILSGARKPGERMPSDADMLKMFGVSRVVTREVIKTLAAKGLVASKMKVGTIVLEPSHWNWLDSDVLSWRANVGMDMDFLSPHHRCAPGGGTDRGGAGGAVRHQGRHRQGARGAQCHGATPSTIAASLPKRICVST